MIQDNHLILRSPFLLLPSVFPASGPFQMSPFFPSGGQTIGASGSASVLPVNIQDWFPLRCIGWISLQSKGLSRVCCNTTVHYSIITRQHIVNARYHSGTHIPHRVSDSVPEQRFNSWTEIGQGNQTHQRKTNSPLEIKTHIRGLIFNTFIPSKETSPMRSLIIPGAKSSLYLGICSQPQQVFLPAHSCVLAWRIPRTEEPFGLQSMGLQRDGHNWATKPTPQSTSVSR